MFIDHDASSLSTTSLAETPEERRRRKNRESSARHCTRGTGMTFSFD